MGEGGDEGGWGKGQIGECRVRGVWEERSVVGRVQSDQEGRVVGVGRGGVVI